MHTLNVFSNLSIYYTWRAPIKKIKLFFKDLKYAYQRVTRGYSDEDTWDLGAYYKRLLFGSLSTFRDGLDSFPSDYSFLDQWKSYIGTILIHLYNSIDENEVYENEYEYIFEKDEYKDTLRLKDNGLTKKWIRRELENENFKKEEFYQAMVKIANRINDLWD